MEVKKHIGALSKWFGTLGIGLMGNWVLTKWFDLMLYPFVIYLYGILWGGLIMMIISFLVTWGEFIFYDWTKRDWLGLETLKGIKDFKPRPIPQNIVGKIVVPFINMMGKAVAWLLKKSDFFVMIFLSIQFEPFITVIYMRHGANQYNGLSRRDWAIFISSVIISNIYWTLAVFMGITLVEYIWLSINGLM